MVTIPVGAFNLVVPSTVPQMDTIVASLARSLGFVEKKLQFYLELKQKQEKVNRFLQQAREKRNRMRKELLRNCRKLLHTHKARESERESQERKREHDMQELKNFEPEKEEEIEEKKPVDIPSKVEDFNMKTLEVNTEKKRFGNSMRRAELYLSSSNSSSSSRKKRASKKEDEEVYLFLT